MRKLLKPVNWKTFPRDFVVIQGGFALYGLSIALLIRAHLGTSPWAVLEVALATLWHLTPGTLSVLMGLLVLVIAVALRESVGWGTLLNILSIGPWEDASLAVLPNVTGNLPLQAGMLLAAVALMGLASAIYIGVNAGAGPRDSLMLAISRASGASLRVARGVLEVTVVLIGWALGGPAGAGTVLFAVLIGPSVQWWFRVFRMPVKVEPVPAKAAAD